MHATGQQRRGIGIITCDICGGVKLHAFVAMSLDASGRARLTSGLIPSHRHPRMTKPPSSELRRTGERTRLVHSGRDPWDQHGFVNTPVYQG